MFNSVILSLYGPNYVNSTIHVTSAATSPVTLLLASVLPTHYSAGHTLWFLLRFSVNLSPVLAAS